MHPATKRFHMIDMVLMRAKKWFCCRDVQVMRGATCWTDHNLVRAKVKISMPKLHQGEKRMLPLAVDKLNAAAVRDGYRCCLDNLLLDYPFRPKLTLELYWEVIKSCIVSAAEESIGRGKRKQLERFEERTGGSD